MSNLDDSYIPQRPAGLVPGSIEWLREIEGPRIVQRLVREVHAHEDGEMTPTAARCASMLLDRLHASLSSVHHTSDGSLANLTDEQLKQQLRDILNNDTSESSETE